jgi:glycosyltransferase involved in cell wall biosynthesis
MEERKNFVFFSMNDFVKEGGGTIRMYGILNALAKNGNEVLFISNAKDYKVFNKSIKHIYIDFEVMPSQKRKLQFLLAVFGSSLVINTFKSLFQRLRSIFKSIEAEQVYFFEYLDNSLGYSLFEKNIINGYVNDLHGIATLEFDFQRKSNTNKVDKILFSFKKNIAGRLDKKVICSSVKNIYASDAMKQFFEEKYVELKNKKSVVIPYLLPIDVHKRFINEKLTTFLSKKFSLKKRRAILFVGAFKLTGGVLTLIKAFHEISRTYDDFILILVGDGYERDNCSTYVNQNSLNNKVFFEGRKPYEQLTSYQEIVDIIVCPDEDNSFSQLIIHVKYLDSLLSNKIVINGSFRSVLELNKNEDLSLNFEPSNLGSLSQTLEKAIFNFDYLSDKYSKNKDYALKNLTYESFLNKL